MKLPSAALTAFALLIAGCGQYAGPPVQVASKVESPIVVAPITEANNLAEWVEKGVSVHSTVYWIKSTEHQNSYWVAARLIGPGLDNTWAIFARPGAAVSDNDASGTLAVDEMACAFSDAPDGCATNTGLCSTSSNAPELLRLFVEALEPSDEKFKAQGKLFPGRSKGRSAEQKADELERRKTAK